MYVKIAETADIPAGSNKGFTVEGRSLLVCHGTNGFTVTNLACPHQNESLEGGKIKAHFLFCPVHGVRFDLTNGEPRGQLTSNCLEFYPCKVEGDALMVDLS